MARMKEIWAPTPENIEKAAQIIRDGGLVICPSDTNLAITIDPWNPRAVERVFEVKRRPGTSPLTLFIAEPGEWRRYGDHEDPERVDTLAKAFWPGPLNIVIKASDAAPRPALMGGDSVSIGCLSNSTPHDLITAVGHPVAMTSANLSGQANGILVDINLAFEQIGSEVDAILDGGALNTTQSSTIISLLNGLKVLRQGDVYVEALWETNNGVR